MQDILANVIRPEWGAPSQVHALVTTRVGGVSEAGWSCLNLARHVGDDPDHVTENRARLLQAMRRLAPCGEPQWLNQVHGIRVVDALQDEFSRAVTAPDADAVYTDQPGIPCVVMTADCLPVFFSSRLGDEVAVAHAGWRGLVGGILQVTARRFRSPSSDIVAWLGPAIGPAAFEVGAEVRDEFLQRLPGSAACFVSSANAGRYMADLYALARLALAEAGIMQVAGGGLCTYSDFDRFYSYRRESSTGRMASVIWRS